MVISTTRRADLVVMGAILGGQKGFVNGMFTAQIPCMNERTMEGICNFLSFLNMLDFV